MKTCPSCGKTLKDEAKFCGGCGHKFPVAEAAPAADSVPASAACPKCGNPLKPGAKFCGKCGAKLNSAATPVQAERLKDGHGFIRWSLIPGQIAVKITEEEVETCGKIKGFVIQDGTKALVFVNGRIAAELAAGTYKLGELVSEERRARSSGRPGPQSPGGFLGLFRRMGDAFSNVAQRVGRLIVGNASADREPRADEPGKSESAGHVVSLMLVRTTEFPLVFTVKEASTAELCSDVGVHLLCKIQNVNEFYRNLLLDRPFVGFAELQHALEPIVRTRVNACVSTVTPANVATDPELASALLNGLQASLSGVYPFLSVSRIVQVTAENQALLGLRRMAEELYVSEQELVQLQKRNDFLNRLQAVKNEQELAELRAANGQEVDKGKLEAEFQARKLDIYKEMSLTNEERAKFDLMLDAERKLREARTQEQINAAMHEFEKSGLLRDRELNSLRHQGRMADLRESQEYEMAELNGELARNRVRDEYADERRRSEIQLDREEQQGQLEMLRQAQSIRIARENDEHRRQLEAENAARAHERSMQQDRLDARLENQRIYAGMSVEQIMAANPDISAEAAKALAQKFNAEGRDELLKAREADMARQSAQQMEMMRMMQQMAMAGMGVSQQHQQEMMAQKQAELERARADAAQGQNRILSSVQSAVAAAGMAFSGSARPSPAPAGAPAAPAVPPTAAKCPNCGAAVESGASFCDECGGAI